MRRSPIDSSMRGAWPGIAASATAVLVALVLVLMVAACGGGYSSTTGTTPTSAGVTTSVPAAGGTTVAPAGPTQVVLQGFAFSPDTVTIAVGGTVNWTNQDSVNHTIVGDNGEFQSSELAAGGTFSFTFDTAGTYTYHCGIHPSMTGTVIVQ